MNTRHCSVTSIIYAGREVTNQIMQGETFKYAALKPKDKSLYLQDVVKSVVIMNNFQSLPLEHT